MKNKNNHGNLKDQLNKDVLEQLQSKKSQLKAHQEELAEKERKRRLEEKRQREANKSFEELLNESDLDWKSFKR
ncbi:YqkE family protein [Halobacillus salinarum]|uniref:YqkE family protein n=1 Tax=Halobacillus salinarum TaxID=2932257 RepID=A0ABY4EDW0_9BACI|nr:YqkE family protein [Halobacillus salinarum]UOQ42636.1 YqkE family protein [Halobacillus salinarum]